MSGVDTVRGIGYQQAQAVLEAIAMLDDPRAASIRVEGTDDVLDLEILDASNQLLAGRQYKTRTGKYSWSQAQLVAVLRRWASLPGASAARFEFVTDGKLGPSAQALATALDTAGRGDRAAIGALLNEPVDGLITQHIARAVIRQDPVGVGALLFRAERQVAAMLPGARTHADAHHQAKAAVDRLFAVLMERAGNSDADARLISRHDVAVVLGVPADQHHDQRWADHVRPRYLQAAASIDLHEYVKPTLRHQQGTTVETVIAGNEDPSPVLTLLQGGPAVLTGRTGEGKTTACRTLLRDAALTGRPVLLAHAEAYLPGRIAALAADAISELLDEAIPITTGSQALSDHEVVLVVDGVSEVPQALQQALADDLRILVATPQNASVILVGRDIAAVRAALPASKQPLRFHVNALDPTQRGQITERLLSETSKQAGNHDPAAIRAVTAQAERALGDAAGNPLLFAMAVQLLGEGVAFTDRAAMYRGFIAQLAARTGAVGVEHTTRALGIVFAQLLDQKRRYADPYEWATLLAQAADTVHAPAVAVDEAARRTGLISALGFDQIIVPMHDSFADYLAGAAQAAGHISRPTQLSASDEQRTLFDAAIAGINTGSAATVVRDLPLLAVQLAQYDKRPIDRSSLPEAAALIEQLLPGSAVRLALWNDGQRVVAFTDVDGGPRWVERQEALDLAGTSPHLTVTGGPLDLATRVWRHELRQRLTPPRALRPHRPLTAESAAALLNAHAVGVAEELHRLLHVLPPAVQASVAARIGPFGLTAHVTRQVQPDGEWSVSYRRTEAVAITADEQPAGDNQIDPPQTGWGRTSLEYLLSKSPAADAAEQVSAALNELTNQAWL